MTCAEFRDLWTEKREVEERESLIVHTVTCAACASWTEHVEILDGVFHDALLVAPPPALATRLRDIAMESPTVAPFPSLWWQYIPEFLVVAFMALGLLGLGGDTSSALGTLVLERVSGILLALSVFFDPPLVNYLAGVWATFLEACAALLLLVLLISRALSYPSGRSTD